MAGKSIVSVQIEGYDAPVIYSGLVLEQSILNHHQLSFKWKLNSFKSDINQQIDVVKNYLGAKVKITFNDVEYIGIITRITIDELNSTAQSFIIQGQSPTVLVDDIPKSCSYYKKDLNEIVKKSLQGIKNNLLKYSIDSRYTNDIHYLTQYNETDFQFLSRLAVRYGEWFYYDGSKLIFGKPGDAEIQLKNGSDTDRISFQVSINPNKYTFKSYDAFKGQPVSKQLTEVSSDIKNTFSSAAIDKSQNTYSRQDERPMHTFNAVNKEQLDNLTILENDSIAARMLTITGEGKKPGIKAGCKFKVESRGDITEYIATSVTHYSNLPGHYENHFSAVPASVKVPPYTDPHVFRKSSAQSALVKENHDTEGINRIKVQFYWQKNSDMSPWIRVTSPHAGSGKGFHFIPEKGEEVMVNFEGGDVDKPFVLGSIYHGGAKSGKGDSDNNVKMLASRSGNVITLDDNKGSISVADSKNNSVTMDGAGNITISGSKSITLNCKDGTSMIVLKDDGAVEITGKDIRINGETINIGGSKNAAMRSGQASFAAEKKSGDANIDGMKVNVTGATEANVHANAKTTISAGGKVAVQGAIVALN